MSADLELDAGGLPGGHPSVGVPERPLAGRLESHEPELLDAVLGDRLPERIGLGEPVEPEQEPGSSRPEPRDELLLEELLDAPAVRDVDCEGAGGLPGGQAEQAARPDQLEVVRRLPESHGTGGIDDVGGDAPGAVLDDREQVVAVACRAEHPGDRSPVGARRREPVERAGEDVGEIGEWKRRGAARPRPDRDGVEGRPLTHREPCVTS